MKKITLIIASLFFVIGAMAQTFVAPEVGKQYKIKGDSESHPWLTANMSSGGNVVVSANEADAAVFEKTENGLKAVSTGKYLGYSGGKYTYNDAEITVELLNTGNQANTEDKYAIRSGGNYMYNNSSDGIVHESSQWLDLPRLWGFIEYKVLADGVYTIQADENGKRGYLAISSNANHGTRPVLTEISWSDYSGNSCTTIVDNSKHWYVKTIDGVTYLSNIGNGKFIYDGGVDEISFRGLPYGLNVAEHTYNGKKYIHVGSGTGTRFLSMGCGTTAPNQVKWEKGNANDGGCLLTFTLVENGTTTYATQIAKAEFMITSAPKAGNYYRLKGNSGNYIDASSIYNNATAKAGQMSMKSADACNLAGTIFYLDENSKLLNYHTGTYITATREIANVGVAGNTWDISASTITGKYKIKSNNNNWLHDNSGNRADRCDQDPDGHSETHSWIIEEVEALPVTISAAGYATFYAPVAVNVPEGVKAYTVTIDGEWAILNEIGNVIPAYTGVVLEGAANTYNFTVSTNTTEFDGENALEGTVAATYITADAYVLTADSNSKIGVCFGKATKNQQNNTSWLNNSHKAYLPASKANGVSFYGFRFGGEDDETTAVETVEISNETEEIFDLAGRRISEITEKGIYIVNGKKVIK